MTFVGGIDGTNQGGIGIGEKSHGIWIERNMRPVFLAIASHALEKFLALFRRLNANAEDLNFSFEISFPLVNKGRHLGPAPRSPAATIEKSPWKAPA